MAVTEDATVWLAGGASLVKTIDSDRSSGSASRGAVTTGGVVGPLPLQAQASASSMNVRSVRATTGRKVIRSFYAGRPVRVPPGPHPGLHRVAVLLFRRIEIGGRHNAREESTQEVPPASPRGVRTVPG